MLTHEYNAQVKGDLFTTPERPFEGADDYEKPASGKSSVLDLLLPVVVLIAVCIISLLPPAATMTQRASTTTTSSRRSRTLPPARRWPSAV